MIATIVQTKLINNKPAYYTYQYGTDLGQWSDKDS